MFYLCCSHRQAAFKFILLVAFVSVGLETPRFFQFRVVTDNNYTDFQTTDLMEDPVYIQFSSYWDELLTTGAVPLMALLFFNVRMILKIRESSRLGNHRFVGKRASARRKGSLTTTTTTIPMRSMSMVQPTEPSPDSLRGKMTRGYRARLVSWKKARKNQSSESDGDKPEDECMIRVEPESSTSLLNKRTAAAVVQHPKVTADQFQKKREKSTVILVLIVLIFIVCHSYRLSLRVYEFSHPESQTREHFERCYKLGRFHIPVVFYVLVSIHHVFLVLNSSINFIIYCCVGKDFREKLCLMVCRRG